ncbi:hypothetical protein EVAR_55681_1 [Eumeta japonica]|uniref:Uncharacterized protein n=1 Tax=Eumeta variegata TaxID=151549 RepID=A0A4C1ZDT3_EUMVA|nr:hypothetical protein EVAR_55681_1 [Eumeta japonica]
MTDLARDRGAEARVRDACRPASPGVLQTSPGGGRGAAEQRHPSPALAPRVEDERATDSSGSSALTVHENPFCPTTSKCIFTGFESTSSTTLTSEESRYAASASDVDRWMNAEGDVAEDTAPRSGRCVLFPSLVRKLERAEDYLNRSDVLHINVLPRSRHTAHGATMTREQLFPGLFPGFSNFLYALAMLVPLTRARPGMPHSVPICDSEDTWTFGPRQCHRVVTADTGNPQHASNQRQNVVRVPQYHVKEIFCLKHNASAASYRDLGSPPSFGLVTTICNLMTTSENLLTQMNAVCNRVRVNFRTLVQQRADGDAVAALVDVALVVYAFAFLMQAMYQSTYVR